MNSQLEHALLLRETDIQGAVYRFNGDERLYVSCLKMFLEDPTMALLNESIESETWDDAFTAAHALKGLAGNMGFVPLMHSTGQLLVIIRGGQIKKIGEYIAQVNSNYRDIADAIRVNFSVDELKAKPTDESTSKPTDATTKSPAAPTNMKAASIKDVKGE